MSFPHRLHPAEKKAPPAAYDLTELQRDANKKYAYSAKETLNIMQSLYEQHKLLTYPRTDSRYISDDVVATLPERIRAVMVENYKPFAQEIMRNRPLKTKYLVNNAKVTDHHAIIPTGQRPDNLSELERKVYNLVALRFIAAFYPDCEVSNTTVLAKVGDVDFKVTGRQILKMGWREVFAKEKQEDEAQEEQKILPAFVKGESGPHEPQLQEKTTTPPKYYTEATLLRAMETAGKTVEDEELRDAMKENGIGRPSTRAAIIEKLFQRKYIVREKKNIHATPLGINLIQTIISPLLKSAELTGLWEKKLRAIERGDYTAKLFLDELKQMTSEVVHEVKADKSGMRCPVCGRGTIIRGKTRYGCSRWREGCTYAEAFG